MHTWTNQAYFKGKKKVPSGRFKTIYPNLYFKNFQIECSYCYRQYEEHFDIAKAKAQERVPFFLQDQILYR